MCYRKANLLTKSMPTQNWCLQNW